MASSHLAPAGFLPFRTHFTCSLTPFFCSWSPHQNPLRAPLPASSRAQLVLFQARREINLPFECGALPPEDYVKEVDRVVKITFPDSARIRYLGSSVWRAQLKPVSFFHLSATPVCDIGVHHENDALQIRSNKLELDFVGLPDQFKRLDLRFSLLGELTVEQSSLLASRSGRDKSFQGWVNLGLQVDLPLPFSLMPEAIVTPVGDGVLDRILRAMEGALLAGLLRDYNMWCNKQTGLTSSSSNVGSFSRGSKAG